MNMESRTKSDEFINYGNKEVWLKRFDSFNRNRIDGRFTLELYPKLDGEKTYEVKDSGVFAMTEQDVNGNNIIRIASFNRHGIDYEMQNILLSENRISISVNKGEIFPDRFLICEIMSQLKPVLPKDALDSIKISFGFMLANLEKQIKSFE
jgi:hypothetical protein